MSAWQQPVVFNNISVTTATFTLLGGKYMVSAVATWTAGSLDLQMLAQDGSTFLSVLAATFTANGVKVVDLPAGTYKFVVATATALYARIDPIVE